MTKRILINKSTESQGGRYSKFTVFILFKYLRLIVFLYASQMVGAHASTLQQWFIHGSSTLVFYSSAERACTCINPDCIMRSTPYGQVQLELANVTGSSATCKFVSPIWGAGYYVAGIVLRAAPLVCANGDNGSTCNATMPTCTAGTFDPRSNKCVVAAENGRSDQSQSCSSEEPTKEAGNPINFATGNKYHQESYFTSPQPGGISFQGYYNSADAVWRHSYSDRLTFKVDKIVLTMADGKALQFLLSGAPKNSAAASHGYLQPANGGWQFINKNQQVYDFDTQGRLTSLKLKKGSTQHLSYVVSSNSTQVFVADEFGSQINFKINTSGGLYALATPNMTMSFSYDAYGQLIKTTKTLGNQQFVRQYHYEALNYPLNLTGITDERGVRYATWDYDTQGRAISSQHAGGTDKVFIRYNADGSSTVINELGKKTTYRFQLIDDVKHITAIEGQPSANCPNSNSSFTYDERGLLKTKTDNKGNLTTFDYNERGLEVSRTEASGTPQARITTTEWHPTLFLPVTVTEPTRITTYTYDAQGRQLSQSVTQR